MRTKRQRRNGRISPPHFASHRRFVTDRDVAAALPSRALIGVLQARLPFLLSGMLRRIDLFLSDIGDEIAKRTANVSPDCGIAAGRGQRGVIWSVDPSQRLHWL